MQLLCIFTELIAFFSDFVHFTFFYPNFCSNFAPQFKITARSSHVHRVAIAHTYTCSQQANKMFRAGANRKNCISFYSSLRGLLLTLSSPHLAVIYQADMEGIDYGDCSW